MALLLLAASLLLVLLGSALVVAREVAHDGYGLRAAPPSQPGWGAVGAPSGPYRAPSPR